MLKEIVLAPGLKAIVVRDLPKLFAEAIYPPVPADAARQVTKIKKIPLTEALKNRACGINAAAFPVSLTKEDMEYLMRHAWRDLPTLELPMHENEFQRYGDAYLKNPLEGWELSWETESPQISQIVFAHLTAGDWKKAIEAEVTKGNLVPRSSLTLLPLDRPTGELLLDSLITVSDLIKFSSQFEIGLILTFISSARPLSVDAELLALPENTEVIFQENIGGSRMEGRCRAGKYRIEIEARIKRQEEGFFTIDEAAQILADSLSGGEVAELIRKMRIAFTTGTLRIRSHGDRLPVASEKDNRNFLSLVSESDMNSWLEKIDCGYRFPSIASTQPKTPNGMDEQSIRPLQRQTAQELEILAVIEKLGYLPTSLPRRIPGKPWVKYEVRQQLKWPGNKFDKAWDRLRNQRRIVEQDG